MGLSFPFLGSLSSLSRFDAIGSCGFERTIHGHPKSICMKLALIIFMLPFLLTAQESGKPKTYRNEVGVDVTSLIDQFFFLNTSNNYGEYRPFYLVTYKRLMKQYSFRLGLGGKSNATKSPDEELPDRVDNSSYGYMDFRIGLEKNIEFSKRWYLHYGFDFMHSIYKRHADRSFSSGGWAFGADIREQRLALAPTVIIEFKINQRLSLQMETNFAVYFSQYENKPSVIPIEAHPSSPLPTTELTENREFGTELTVPRFLILAAKL